MCNQVNALFKSGHKQGCKHWFHNFHIQICLKVIQLSGLIVTDFNLDIKFKTGVNLAEKWMAGLHV